GCGRRQRADILLAKVQSEVEVLLAARPSLASEIENEKRVHTGRADPPSGERGIRTLDTRFHVCRFSKPVPSASRPSLRESFGSYWRSKTSTTRHSPTSCGEMSRARRWHPQN